MKAFILHGTKGSPQGNWYFWLASELQKLGVESIVPLLPTPENQSLDNWRKAFKAQCGNIAHDTILVGHSCGAVLLMRLLEEANEAAACTVLVAPLYKQIGIPEYDHLNSSFLSAPFDWRKITSHAGKLDYFMADNDPYVPQDQLITIARYLDVEPRVVSGGGHLNAEVGFTTFPQLLRVLQDFLTEQSQI